MTPSIAFVGLGSMGSAMARRLLEAGYTVTGYDVRGDAMTRFTGTGGKAATSVAEAAGRSDVLIVMTVDADQADAVLFDAGGVAALPPDGTVIVMSTCAPARVVAMANRVVATGRRFVDAPVSGGVAGATAGTLTIMAAAPAGMLVAVEPVLRVMGSNLVHIGERAGQGSAMKIVNQLLCGVHIAVAAEGLAFAERQGIDPARALEILSGSAASSWMLKDRGPRMVSHDPTVTSTIDIFVKDLGLVLDAGRSTKVGLPLAALAHQMFLAASGMGLGAADDSQVIETFRALAPP
jgi:3-hydroxyisobutyrate dehydrogenase